MPIILVTCLEFTNEFTEAIDSLYGETVVKYEVDKDQGKLNYKGPGRNQNGLFHKQGANIIAAVCAYKRQYPDTPDQPVRGMLLESPIQPINQLGEETRRKICMAFFCFDEIVR
jgi:copper chaperone CopZ